MLALFLTRDLYSLGLREARASRRVLSEHGTEELRSVVRLVSIEEFVTVLCVKMGSM
jgi:hypothetical protein